MPARRIAVAIFACSIACATDADSEIKRLNNHAAELYTAGRFEEAEQLYNAALALHPIGELTVATITSNLAALYKQQDRYADAGMLYQRVIEIRRKLLGPSDPQVALAMNNLAEIRRIQGLAWEARNLLQSGIRILEQADPHGSDIAVLLNNLAVLDRNAAHYDEAQTLLERTLALSEEHHGPDSRPVAIALNNLAQVLEDKQDFGNASRLYSRALANFEGCRCVTDSAITLANLGRLNAAEAQYHDAERAENRALALLAGRPGTAALLRGAILQNLANIRAAEGETEDALELFQQSLTIRSRVLGPASPALAGVLFDYAEVALRAGKKSEARKLQRRARSLLAIHHQENPARFTVGIGELRSLR